MTLVSVCIVTYNHENYIRDCIMSVLMQQFDGELEIIVGQDGSTDTTASVLADLCAEFPNRLVVLDRAVNIGPFENLRDIVTKARGDFIAHLDGDDYWMPGKLQAQLDFLAANKDCVAVYTNAHVIDTAGVLKGAFNDSRPSKFDTGYLLRGGNFLNHSSMVYRRFVRAAITDVPGTYIDYRIHLRLSARGPLGYINQDLAAYRVATATSMMAHNSAKVQALYWEALADKDLASRPLDDLRTAVARGLAQSWLTSLYRGKFNNQLREARALGALAGLGSARVLALAFAIFSRLACRRLLLRIARIFNRNPLMIYYER